MNSQISYLRFSLAVSLIFAMAAVSRAQTYKVNSGTVSEQDQQQTDQQKNNQAQKNAQSKPRPQSDEKSLGWGSNIQNARLARAAEAA
ncbi:MAG: hypothetical protein WA618_04270, partial [Terriglobales bacterium]